MDIVKVPGKNKVHKIFLYALSTCVWCKRTKKFLKDNDLAFEYIDVDLCSGEEVSKIKNDMLNRSSRIAYPMIIIDDKILISGFPPYHVTLYFPLFAMMI